MSTFPVTANVHPLVRIGAAAHFMMPDKSWHRSELYPGICLCGVNPMHATVIKPSVDDSWRYVSDQFWGACISKLAKYEEHNGPTFLSLKDGTTLTVGLRVVLDPEAALLYDQGTKADWCVETVGRANGEVAPIVKIRDKSTGVYAWSPVHWLSAWTPAEPTPAPEPWPELAAAALAHASPEETPMGMADPRDPDIQIAFVAKATDDALISCFLCRQEKCTHEFLFRGNGERAAIGVHQHCVERVTGGSAVVHLARILVIGKKT